MQYVACTETQVVVGVQDPNPLVAGAGMQTLRDAGIAVAGPCEVIPPSVHTCLSLFRLKNRTPTLFLASNRTTRVLKYLRKLECLAHVLLSTGDGQELV